MSLLLLKTLALAHLGVADKTDRAAVLLDELKVLLNSGLALLVLLGILGECLLLGLVPVLVEATPHFVVQVLSPYSLERTQTVGGLHVADHTDNNHGRSFNECDSLARLLLVELGAGLVHITENVSASSLVTHESGQVALGRGIILREGLDLAAMTLGALFGKEPQGTVTRVCTNKGKFS